MKVCILGNTNLGYSWFVLTYKQGLQLNGHHVMEIDYKSTSMSELRAKLLYEKPALVFCHLTFHQVYPVSMVLDMFRDVNKKVGTRFIHTCNDARNVDRFMGDVSGAYHMAFVGTYGMVENCSLAWGIPVYYSPYSTLTYEKMAEPAKDLMFTDAVFTGSRSAHLDRKSFLDRLSKKIPIKFFETMGKGDLRNRTPELSASAKCILGFCTGYEGLPGFLDVRPFQYLGTGATMIMRKFMDMDKLIPPDLYFPIDSYDDEAVEKAAKHYNYILSTDTSQMQREAFRFMQTYHSSKVRIAEVLKRIDEL